MATFTFEATWCWNYFTLNGNRDTHYLHGPGIYQGIWGDNSSGYPWGGRKALIGFNTTAIRNALAGKTVTGAGLMLGAYKWDDESHTGKIHFGTHNYTSVPNVWDTNRVTEGRTVFGPIREHPANEELGVLGLSASIGREFQAGTSTGVSLGAVPNQDSYWDGMFWDLDSDSPAHLRPKIVIYVKDDTPNPNQPTLQSPPAGHVADVENSGISLDFVHSDPRGSGMAAYYLKRTRDGVDSWWNGTDFVATPTRMAASTAAAIGSIRRVTIPRGKWTNRPATSPFDYWTVATESNTGLTGAYASLRQIFPSTPPSVVVNQPTGAAYRSDRPIIRWTYSDADGTAQFGWIAQIVAPEVYNKPGYDPQQFTGQVWSYSGDVESARSAQSSVTLENHKTYRAYVRVVSSPNPAGGLQYSTWRYSEFTVSLEPPPPKVLVPRHGSTVDLQAGFTLDWENEFSSEGGSQQQAAYAIRRVSPGGAYQWWNGIAWTANEFFASGSSSAYSFRPNEVLNGYNYTFSVAIRDGYGLVSGYSSGVSVFGSTAPQIAVVSPPSFITTVNPLVTWTMYDLENDPQQTYRVLILQRPTGGFPETISDPLTRPAVWDSTEVASAYVRSLRVPLDLTNNTAYRVYLRIKAGGVYSEWAYNDFTVSLVPPAAPAGSTEIRNDIGGVEITIQGRDSMLSLDASRCTADWVAATGSDTLTQAVPFTESFSGYLSTISHSVTGATRTIRAQTAQPQPVVSGVLYSVAVTVLNAQGATPVDARVGLQYLTAAGVVTLERFSNVLPDASGVRLSISATAPPAAVSVRQVVEYINVPANSVHRFFDPVMRPGEGVEWTPGGLLGSTYVSVVETNDGRAVRHGLNIPIPTAAQRIVLTDEETPIGAEQVFEVTARAVYPGAVLVSEPLNLGPIRWSSGWLWLSDPARPNSARSFGPQSFNVEERPAQQGKYRALGRADAIITQGVRGLREGGYTIVTHTKEERKRYYEVVDESDLILLRIPPDRGELEGETLYVRLEGNLPTKRPLASRTPHREIEQAWTEQPRPEHGLLYGEDF